MLNHAISMRTFRNHVTFRRIEASHAHNFFLSFSILESVPLQRSATSSLFINVDGQSDRIAKVCPPAQALALRNAHVSHGPT
jgi:hypothetical protein